MKMQRRCKGTQPKANQKQKQKHNPKHHVINIAKGKKQKKKRIYYALYVSTVSDSTKLLICMHYAVCTVLRDAIRKVRFQYQMMYEIVEQVA
jgi:hypothetical protein